MATDFALRHELELSAGYQYDDCPRLGRAGLAINRCDDQVPDHAGLLLARTRLYATFGEHVELSLEERLRLVAPRRAGDLTSLDAVTEPALQIDFGSRLTLRVGGILALHAEPDPAWQSMLGGPYLELSLATGFGLTLELRQDLQLLRFPTSYPKNSYAQIDADVTRTTARVKWWRTPVVRLTASYEGTGFRYHANVDDRLAEIVKLEEGEHRRDFTHGFELEAAVRPHPAALGAIAARAEVNSSNWDLLRYRAFGGGIALAFGAAPHTVALAGRFMRYDFFDAFPAREAFNNTRKDNHWELYARYRVELSNRVSASLAYTWVFNDSNDGVIFQALVDGFVADGVPPLTARGLALDDITSFSLYARSLLEARITVSW